MTTELSVKDKPLRQVSSFAELIQNNSAKRQLAQIAAKHMNPDRMMRVIANAARNTPKLRECEPMSLLGALMNCAAMGLEPNTPLGHAYLIPFKNNKKGVTEVQVIIGYRGLMQLAYRSGEILAWEFGVHRDDDVHWLYRKGSKAVLEHEPGPELGDILHAYSVVTMKGGGVITLCYPIEKIVAIRNASQGWQTAVRYNRTAQSPWSTHLEAMAMKTVIRAIAKFLPLSVEFQQALDTDEQRADYGSFALDPGDGVTIDGDATDVSDEEPPVEGQAIAGDPPQEKEPAKKEPAKKKPETKPRTAATAKAKAAAEKAAAQQGQGKPSPERERQLTDGDTPQTADEADVVGQDPAPTEEDPAWAKKYKGLLQAIEMNLADCSTLDHINSSLALYRSEIKEAWENWEPFRNQYDELVKAYRDAIENPPEEGDDDGQE